VIYLASRSPQRRALIASLGCPYRVVVAHVEEITHGDDPRAIVADNARAKALDVAARSGIPPNGAVIGADTEVVLDGVVFGKPRDREDARRMLRALSGRAHQVMTGFHIVTRDHAHGGVEVADVTMRALSGREIDWYAATGEWRERAGGYAIQGAGAVLISRLDGDISTVVGLPIARIAQVLIDEGLWPCEAAPERHTVSDADDA
jgi:septum formation protein